MAGTVASFSMIGQLFLNLKIQSKKKDGTIVDVAFHNVLAGSQATTLGNSAITTFVAIIAALMGIIYISMAR